LASLDRSTPSSARERPGCVTAYAVLLGIAAALIALGGIVGGISMMADRYGSVLVGFVTIVIASVIAVLYFLLARGLWLLRNWARIIVIVLQSLGILVSLLSMCGTLAASSGSYGYQSNPGAAICGAVVGLAIGGYIIYWFASHGEYFD